MESDFQFAAGIKKEDAVKTFALAATLAMIMCGSAQARLVEVASERGAANIPSAPEATTAAPPGGTVRLQSATSDLAEPEMFAMMAVGLVLIGYRATRDSSEKFK
ncbi:MAG: hypothetical protein JWQ01_2422 [Massilia sp.]|jgi:hypothetical protein|nr:hypothetical protein [Massilia sp.]